MASALAKADRERFRESMARLAATVHILTARHEGHRYGMTITAASSLSADPMSIIVSVHRGTATHEAMMRSRRLCLNMLSPGHDELAIRFSGALGHRGDERFEAGDWICEGNAPPVLQGAAAALQCDLVDRHSFGTHDVMLCHVGEICLGLDQTALVYANRRYGTVRLMADPQFQDAQGE